MPYTPTYDANIFSKILAGDIPCHKVYEDDFTLAFMDIMPVATGHVLVIPKCEAVEMSDLPLNYASAVFATAQKVLAAQRAALGVTGVVQFQLNGAEAGQSVFHYHMHLIPTHLRNIHAHESSLADHETLAAIAEKLRAHIAD